MKFLNFEVKMASALFVRAGDNPFRSSRLESLKYTFERGSHEQLLKQCELFKYRGAIVGAHGTGKTTLLRELQDHLRGKHFETELISLHDWCRTPQWRNLEAAARRKAIIFLDGAELLSRFAWFRLRCITRHAAGLILTSHTPGLLPTLYTTTTSFELFEQLTRELLEGEYPAESLRSLYEKYQGNLRQCFFELYDLYPAICYSGPRYASTLSC